MLDLKSVTVLVILLQQFCADSSRGFQLKTAKGPATQKLSSNTLNKDYNGQVDTVLRFVPQQLDVHNKVLQRHGNVDMSGYYSNVSVLGDDYDNSGGDSEVDVSDS